MTVHFYLSQHLAAVFPRQVQGDYVWTGASEKLHCLRRKARASIPFATQLRFVKSSDPNSGRYTRLRVTIAPYNSKLLQAAYLKQDNRNISISIVFGSL
jgi:hypothetical protein